MSRILYVPFRCLKIQVVMMAPRTSVHGQNSVQFCFSLILPPDIQGFTLTQAGLIP